MAIRNYQQLRKKLNEALKETQHKLTIEIQDLIKEFIVQYYKEFTPNSYDRTEQFLNSCLRIDPRLTKDGYKSYVYIDYKNMSYVYYPQNKSKTFVGDGLMVVQSANLGRHGAIYYASESDTHFWDDGLDMSWKVLVLNDFVAWLSDKTGCVVKRK